MRFRPMKDNPRLHFEPFWNELAAKGVKTIIFDVTSTPMRNDAPGIQIIDWNTQCNVTPKTNRADILRQVRRQFGAKPIKDEIPVKKSRRMLTQFRDDLIESLRLKTDAIIWMMRSHEWQFFLTGYFEGHRAGHNLWPIWEEFASDPPKEALLDVYRVIDTQIGRIQAELDMSQTALVLFSMHGMTPGYAQDHFLPAIMDRINAVYFEKTGRIRPQYKSRYRADATAGRSAVSAIGRSQSRGPEGTGLADRQGMARRQGLELTPGFPVPGGGEWLHQAEYQGPRA